LRFLPDGNDLVSLFEILNDSFFAVAVDFVRPRLTVISAQAILPGRFHKPGMLDRQTRAIWSQRVQSMPIIRTFHVLTIAIAAGLAAPAMAQDVVNFGVQPSTQPILIAHGAGWLKPIEDKYKIKIVLRSFSYGAPENQAMAAGEIQIASAGMGPAILAAARLPATLVAIDILDQTAILVPKDSKITSVAGLKGAKIAFPGEGSQQYPLLIKALADAKLTVKDVQLFKTDGSQVATLLANKSVDAGITWDPHVSRALADGVGRVLASSAEIMPIKNGHYVGDGTYVRDDFMKAHPDIVQDLISAEVKAIDLILKDPDKAIDIWTKENGFPRAVIEYAVKQKISVFDRNVVPAKSTVDAYTSFLKKAGLLKDSDNPKFETKFAEQALKDVK
jgi:sulfonate transport system substrate-binding protein